MTAVRYVEFSKSIVYVMWPLSPYVVLLLCAKFHRQSADKLWPKTIFKMAAVRICVPNSIQIGWFFVENEICRFHDFQDGGSTQSWKSTDAGEFTVTAAGQFTSTPAGPTVKFTPDHSRAENFTSQSVLTATFNSDGDRQISTPPPGNQCTLTDRQKFNTIDFVGEGTSYTKFGRNKCTESFWANGWNIT